MEIILLERIEKLGAIGDVVTELYAEDLQQPCGHGGAAALRAHDDDRRRVRPAERALSRAFGIEREEGLEVRLDLAFPRAGLGGHRDDVARRLADPRSHRIVGPRLRGGLGSRCSARHGVNIDR